MKFSVQTDNVNMLKEALGSDCDKIRFGPEFCEWKIPSLSEFKKAHMLAKDLGKEFAYVTPRVSDKSIQKIRQQLDLLNEKEGETVIIVNDLGIMNILHNYPELRPHLGRQLVHIPARCPWPKLSKGEMLLLPLPAIAWKHARRKVEDVYSQTSLNYTRTIQLYRDIGVKGVDLDWIPRCFPYYNSLAKDGFSISIHLHLVPATITRKCHTARFVGEGAPENCSKPCDKRAFLLKHKDIGLELFLYGNVVFSLMQSSKRDVENLKGSVDEFVVTMNPVTKMSSKQKINELIHEMRQTK